MLSTLLSQLQSYFSKYFVIGSFCPVLVFTFLNGLTAYLLSARWRAQIDPYITAPTVGRAVFVIASLTVAMVLAAYVLSSLSTLLRRLLEGRWWEPLTKLFIPVQNKRRQLLIAQMEAAAMTNADLDDAPQWASRLRAARQTGSSKRKGTKFNELKSDSFEGDLKRLEGMRDKNEVLPADDLSRAVETLAGRLETHDVNQGHCLDRHHIRINHLIHYARDRAKASHARLLNQLHSSYGAEEVAPTKMGNIANTIQGYALRRYKCNLELVWSNLQRVVQKDEKAQTALQEAKTQIDFLVACCWLTLLWSLVWTVVFALIAPSRWGFLTAALGGPVLAYVWYRAAAEQYRSFADIAMTTLDSLRFDLLKEMRLTLPADVEGERYVWESVDRLSTYDEERNFRYEQPKQPDHLAPT